LDNPEKLAAYDTKDEEKQSITQHIRGENLFMQTNTNNVKKDILQTTGGKDEQNIVFMRKSE
jgi:hypothetical protein